ncbi:hypothetical protein HYV86_02355 [Candidatus Woesearchaeota archaeon]|nr:hypothetical protein [Candidatus Woesearchaeota archaeon]
MVGYMRGVEKTWLAIKSYKIFFALLCVFQLLLLGAAAIIFLHYQLAILQDVQSVLEPLEGATLDEQALQNGQPFVEDFLPLYRGYSKLISDLKMLAAWMALFFIFGGGLLWVASHHLIHRLHWRDAGRIMVRYILGSAITLLLFTLFLTLLIQAALANIEGGFNWQVVVAIIIGVVLYLVLLVATLHSRIVSWKEWMVVFGSSLTRKLGFHLLVFFMGWVVLLVFLGLMGIAIAYNSGIVLLLFVLFSIVLVLVRMYDLVMVAEQE